MTKQDEQILNNGFQILEDFNKLHHIYIQPAKGQVRLRALTRGKVKTFSEAERMVFAMRRCRAERGEITLYR